MNATVRRATVADRASAVALWTSLHREHEALDARYRLAADAAARWSTDFGDWARSATDRIWLAEAGGAAVGLLTAHLYVPAPTFAPSEMVYVDDLYVAPDVRGRGIGTLLLDEARAWGHATGASEVRAGVLATNPAGRRFWARAGARDFSVVVTLALT
ncbi:MAG TPA: GNAT family N-acetyltransferase [Rubricoccaceae bacterium]|jgi:GNAT superfamily N-acetyltransferase